MRGVRDQARSERPGVESAARIGTAALQAALSEFRNGGDPVDAFNSVLDASILVLRDAMIVAQLGGVRRPQLDLQLALTTTPTYRKQIDVLQRQLDLTDASIEAIGDAYVVQAEEIISSVQLRSTRAVQATLVDIQTRGLHVRDGVKELSRTFANLGITPRNSFTFENIFRTEIAKAYSAGRWQHNSQPAIQDILVSYKYVTVGDDRVRPEHAALDGIVLPKNDPLWDEIWPPNGFACRCTTIEVFDDRAEVRPPETFTTTQNGKEVTVKPGADPGFQVNQGKVLSSQISDALPSTV